MRDVNGSVMDTITGGQENGIILLQVRDNGAGMNAEQLAQLQNGIFQEKQGGFGIGLAIAAAIAEKHGGSIAAAMEGSRLAITCLLPKE